MPPVISYFLYVRRHTSTEIGSGLLAKERSISDTYRLCIRAVHLLVYPPHPWGVQTAPAITKPVELLANSGCATGVSSCDSLPAIGHVISHRAGCGGTVSDFQCPGTILLSHKQVLLEVRPICRTVCFTIVPCGSAAYGLAGGHLFVGQLEYFCRRPCYLIFRTMLASGVLTRSISCTILMCQLRSSAKFIIIYFLKHHFPRALGLEPILHVACPHVPSIRQFSIP